MNFDAKSASVLRLFSSALVPFVLQAAFLVAIRSLMRAGYGVGDVGILTPLLSGMAGLLFVTPQRTRSQKLLVALVYLPVMYLLLMMFSMGFIGRFYGDWL
jgi:hypothetical protein